MADNEALIAALLQRLQQQKEQETLEPTGQKDRVLAALLAQQRTPNSNVSSSPGGSALDGIGQGLQNAALKNLLSSGGGAGSAGFASAGPSAGGASASGFLGAGSGASASGLGGGFGGSSGASAASGLGSAGPIGAIIAAAIAGKAFEKNNSGNVFGKVAGGLVGPSISELKEDPVKGGLSLLFAPMLRGFIQNDKARRATPELFQLFGK